MRSLSRPARIASILALTALVNAEGLSQRNTSPFFPALGVFPPSRIQARQNSNGNCPDDTHSCASISYPGFCCINSASCALDSAGHIACCPNGIVCVGTVTQEGGRCNSGYYSCPDSLYDGGCCLSGYEYCGQDRCINSNDALAALVAAVPGLITSVAGNGVGVYRTLTDSAGALVTSFIGDAGAVYSSYVADPAGAAESWLGSVYTKISTGITGFPLPTISVNPDDVASGISSIISDATSEFGDFRSDLGGWYTSFTSRYGAGYTSFLNEAGQYVTSVQTVINGVVTQTAVTVQFPAFVQAQPTGNAGARSIQVPVAFRGDRMGSAGPPMFLWVWAIGLGFFTVVVGWL
ncbi:hypothetical protein ABW19_dt0206978 [Dactylella cylindrospora]|nr:hypothetical protein ABW19_dt0206978 [Dactylella cylindrospora]